MRYFIDTEFIEDGRTIEPISLAVVSEDGREFYVEFEFDESRANAFVREHVIPHLRNGEKVDRPAAARLLLDFIGDDWPEFWSWYGAYDWVLVCQLFGAMADLPKHFPMFIRDLRQLTDDPGVPQPLDAHHALVDARWLRLAHAALERRLAAHAHALDLMAPRPWRAWPSANIASGKHPVELEPTDASEWIVGDANGNAVVAVNGNENNREVAQRVVADVNGLRARLY